MTRWFSWPIALAAAVLTGCGTRPAAEPIYVGHLVPLGGPDRAAGEHARQAVRLAVTEAAEAHWEAGGRPFAVVHADTRDDPELVKAETVRLLTVNRVAALLAGPRAATAERVIRADQPYGVPVVIPGDLPEVMAYPGVRALGAPPTARGRALARYASQDLRASKTIVFTDSREPVAAAVADAYKRTWPGGARARVEEWSFASAADTAHMVSRAARARPDVILLACSTRDLHDLSTGLAEAGYPGAVLYGGEDTGPPSRTEDSGPDVYVATVYCTEKLTDRGKEFARRYEAEFHEPPDLSAAQAYDGVCLLFEILQRAENRTPSALRQELERTDSFASMTGPITWKGHLTRRAFFLVHIKDGKRTVVQTVEPEE